MKPKILLAVPIVFLVLLILHIPLLRLPYYWDEAGYYVPAALDFYRHALLIPRLSLPTGHTPLVMIYLGVIWHLFGFTELSTRAAIILIAALTVVATYGLGCRVAGREAGLWAATLLSLSPLFFAQSSLVFLDLTAALFTTLALLFALTRRWSLFALAASLAVLSKETAVVMLIAVWAFLWFRRQERRAKIWMLSAIPIIPLALWAIYYHSHTGYWTGNSGYLQYNLYSALTPLHALRSLVARLGELFVQGFNWLITGAAAAGIWIIQKKRLKERLRPLWLLNGHGEFGDFLFLALVLIAVYIVMLSVVGGAILPRYMLPVFPVFFVLAVSFIGSFPKAVARTVLGIAVACFVASWFINPPYPFPYEDNIAYATFVHLHQRAAWYLESLPGNPIILTAWPATDELKQPFLGYVNRPLRVSQVDDFTPAAFAETPRFDILYLYSRKWEPADNWLTTFHPLRAISRRFYDYQPAAPASALAARFHLKLLKELEDRGQWVRIYSDDGPTQK